MSPILQHGASAARTLVGWFFSFVLWTVWLALVLLLVAQLYILSANELELPEFVLRRAESKLAESGLRATFRRTSFDPTGRVLLEDVRISLPAYSEPVVMARAIYVRLNPLALIVGRFDPREIRVLGAQAAVPAMLSPTGAPEQMVRRLEATLRFDGAILTIAQFDADVAGVALSANGTLLISRRNPKPASARIAEFLNQKFPAICRQAATWAEQIAQFEEPAIHLEITPSESGAIIANVVALSRQAKLAQPFKTQVTNLQASTRLLLFGEAPPSEFDVAADEIRLPQDALLRGVHAHVNGRIRPADAQFDLRDVAVTTDAITVAGVEASAVAAQIFPRPLPRLEAHLVGNLLGAPLAAGGTADLSGKTAALNFTGEISPRVLDVISQRVGVDVRKYYSFDALTVERGEANFATNWAFDKLTAQVLVPRMNSYGVIMEDGRATVELDPQRFYSPEAFARVGQNFAHGTYEHDLKTHDYRFLLEGRLRPLEISPWFREWWPNFFRQLEFPVAPPNASVDVAGSWRDGSRSRVFVFADVPKPIIRGAAFDRVRTRLFIRPTFYDGLEVLATHGSGDAHGRFTYTAEPENHEWHTLELALDSTLELSMAAQILGPNGAKMLAPFELAGPPIVKMRGSFAGPAAPKGTIDTMRIEARSKGDFRFHHFPLQNVSFIANFTGDDLVLDDVEASFGGGTVTGHARVWGAGAQRRVGFDAALHDASLGPVAAGLQEFFAAQKNQPAAGPAKFVQEKANVRLDFAASAEGGYDNVLSYHGDGSVVMRGAEIGAVPLLGALSELLKFTALRFTEARANFKIDGPRLVFPQVELRGANSAIDAHGEYAIDKHDLDFNAKIFPFHESENILKSVVGAVLSPLSSAFEVKLSGSLEKPHWALLHGPSNILHALAQGGDAEPKAENAAAPKDPAETSGGTPRGAVEKPPTSTTPDSK